MRRGEAPFVIPRSAVCDRFLATEVREAVRDESLTIPLMDLDSERFLGAPGTIKGNIY